MQVLNDTVHEGQTKQKITNNLQMLPMEFKSKIYSYIVQFCINL